MEAEVWRDEHGRLVWRDLASLTDQQRLDAYLALTRREQDAMAPLRFRRPE